MEFGATLNLLCNPWLIMVIHKVKKDIWVHYNGRDKLTNQMGTLDILGDIWIVCNRVENIFYMSRVW